MPRPLVTYIDGWDSQHALSWEYNKRLLLYNTRIETTECVRGLVGEVTLNSDTFKPFNGFVSIEIVCEWIRNKRVTCIIGIM